MRDVVARRAAVLGAVRVITGIVHPDYGHDLLALVNDADDNRVDRWLYAAAADATTRTHTNPRDRFQSPSCRAV